MKEKLPKIEIQDEIQRFMELHGFSDEDQILKIPAEELLKMDGFGYRMLNEILSKT